MKATELIIDDWVTYMGTTPCKILSITPSFVRIANEKTNTIITSDFEDISPLPLTKAILRHSGWDVTDSPATQGKPIGKIKVKRQGDYDYEIQYRIGHYFRLDAFLRKELMKPNVVYTFFPPVTIIIDHNWGVHELQHALRLLGFGDVADNFEI